MSVLIEKIMELDENLFERKMEKKMLLEKIETCLKVLISERYQESPDPQLLGLAPHFYSEHVHPTSDNDSDAIVWKLQQLASVFAKDLKYHLRKTEEDQKKFEFHEFKENANVINAIAADLQKIFNKKMGEHNQSIHMRYRYTMS